MLTESLEMPDLSQNMIMVSFQQASAKMWNEICASSANRHGDSSASGNFTWGSSPWSVIFPVANREHEYF